MSEFSARDGPQPSPDTHACRLVSALALLYLRHADAPRALALGLAAMQYETPTPTLALVVAEAFLRTGEPNQAIAILARFEGSAPRLDPPPDVAQCTAMQILKSKAIFRLGRRDEARALLIAATDAQRTGQGLLQ